MLEGAQLTPTDAEYLRCSMTAANTLLSIIDQLLDYSKWHRDSVDDHRAQRGSCSALASAPMRICTVLDELVDVVGGRAASKGVSLRVEATAGVQAARLCGDAPRLRQVLLNLTENALKFVRAGGTVAVVAATCAAPPRRSSVAGAEATCRSSVAARVSSARLHADALSATTIEPLDAADTDADSPQQWLRIEVADDGAGIPPEDHWRLFKPFSQIQQQTAPGLKPTGTGLGLVISRAIIREMNGDITFDSLPGVGTTFTIVVPFYRDPEVPDAVEDAEAAEAASALAGVTVLPLLRDAAMRGTLARMAATWGAKTVAAASETFPQDGEAALNAAELLAAVQAAAAHRTHSDAPLLVLADAAALTALQQGDALPTGVCCVLTATPAERAAAKQLEAARGAAAREQLLLDLPTSPGRLFARLRAAAAVASAPPRAPDSPHAAAVEPALPLAPPAGAAALRVLLAEDNAMNAMVAKAVLARCGVKAPCIVGDGELAVAAFRESLAPGGQPWSIILLDMQARERLCRLVALATPALATCGLLPDVLDAYASVTPPRCRASMARAQRAPSVRWKRRMSHVHLCSSWPSRPTRRRRTAVTASRPA